MSALSRLRALLLAPLALVWSTTSLRLVADTTEQTRWTHVANGWLGGDGSYPTRLPDGRVAWAFGDSLVRRPDGSTAFIHGTLVVESGGSLSRVGPVADLIPPTVPGTVVWPTASYVDGSYLRVAGAEVDTGGGGFRFTGRRYLLSLTLPGLAHAGVVPFGPSGDVDWGHAFWTSSSYVYAYGNLEVSGWENRTYLARFPRGATSGPWQYWDGLRFQPAPLGSALRGSDGATLGAKFASVLRLADGRFAAYGIDPFGARVWVRTGANPWGPWSPPATAFTLPTADAQAGAYLPRLLREGAGVRGAYSYGGADPGLRFLRTG